eukprot:5476449-Karenia_brevis.AAC.1
MQDSKCPKARSFTGRMSPNDELMLVRGYLGKVYKKHKQALPPKVRASYVQLLLGFRFYSEPAVTLSLANLLPPPHSNIMAQQLLHEFANNQQVHKEDQWSSSILDVSRKLIEDQTGTIIRLKTAFEELPGKIEFISTH